MSRPSWTAPFGACRRTSGAQILERAEGVPFYAVETVRMLLDQGLLVRSDGTYRPTGPITSLEIPATLQALIAARLDGLDPRERHALQDASVLGRTFMIGGLAAVSGIPEDESAPDPGGARPQGDVVDPE